MSDDHSNSERKSKTNEVNSISDVDPVQIKDNYSSKKEKLHRYPEDEENFDDHAGSKKKKVEHVIITSLNRSKTSLTEQRDKENTQSKSKTTAVFSRPSFENAEREKKILGQNLLESPKMTSRKKIQNKENSNQKQQTNLNASNSNFSHNFNNFKSPDNVLKLKNQSQSNITSNQKSNTNGSSNIRDTETLKKSEIKNKNSSRSSKSVDKFKSTSTNKKTRSSKSVERDSDEDKTLKWEETTRGKSPGVKKFKCTAQLIEWAQKDTIRSELDRRNTEALKAICQENGVPRSGAKYELISRLMDNAEKGIRKMLDDQLQAEADAGNKRSEVELTFSKFKSFEASLNHAKKMIKKMEELPDSDFKGKLAYLAGISRGVDSQLLIAITGPKYGKYNGKYDEIGIDGNNEIAQEWLRFLQKRIELGLDLDQLDQFIKESQGIDKCIPYGFDSYFEIIGNDVRKLLKDDEVKLKMWNDICPEKEEKRNGYFCI